MSDEPSQDFFGGRTPASARSVPFHGYAHSCKGCGKGAVFGFNTRGGDDWYCGEHRHLGQAIPPSGVKPGS